MRETVAAIAALLFATAILYTGSGLQGTLLPVRANLEGFPTVLIGAMMSAYYAGFIAGCRMVPGMITSAGHIRTFVALASVASASALAHALIVDVYVWGALRAITGFCFAGIAMVLESWINERATNDNRGKILSIYRIVDLVALTAGNALLTVANPAGFHLFALCSIIMSVALVPIALTRSSAPQPVETALLKLRQLIAVSPVGAVGSIATGIANAAFWAVGAVFAQRLGYDAGAIAAFMSSVIIGAAVSQWPVGWLSDKIDRRIVICGASIIGALAAIGLARFGGQGVLFLTGFGFAFGMLILPMYGLCAAHANDHATPEDSVSTNGGLLLLHGFGAILGAMIGAAIMAQFGASSLFTYIAFTYLLFAVFCLLRIISSRAVPDAQKNPFIPIPRAASPAVFEIAEEDENEEEEQRD